MVTKTINTRDPPLLTTLLTSSARAQALRAHGGHPFNCNGTDHSMRTCPQDFLNTSGISQPCAWPANRWWPRLPSMATTDAFLQPGTVRAQRRPNLLPLRPP